MRKFNLGDKVANKANVISWAAGTRVDPKISEIYQVTEKAEGTLFWAVGLHSSAYEKELLHVHEINYVASAGALESVLKFTNRLLSGSQKTHTGFGYTLAPR